MDFILENWGTLLVTAILLFVFSVIIITLVKDKKSGKSSCGCSCKSCGLNGKCHTKENKEEEKTAE